MNTVGSQDGNNVEERPFNSKNRAGVDGTLHRISAVIGDKQRVLGLTYRIGRHVEGQSQHASRQHSNSGVLGAITIESLRSSMLFHRDMGVCIPNWQSPGKSIGRASVKLSISHRQSSLHACPPSTFMLPCAGAAAMLVDKLSSMWVPGRHTGGIDMDQAVTPALLILGPPGRGETP